MSLSDDDLLSRVYAMSGTTDDDDDTRRLREIHAAYRSLPEEEPPERGLAELMAAARVKADEMKPAPWWRVLFRPPVLALASVMVLVGGALLIGRHGDSMKAESPTAPAETTRKDDTNDLSLDKGPAANGAPTTKALEIASGSPMKEKAADQPDKGGETPPTVTLGASGHGATTTPPPAQNPAGSASNATPPPRPVVEHAPTHRPENRQTVSPVEPRPPAPPPAAPKIDPTSTTTGTPAGGADGRVAPDDDRDGPAKTEATKDEAKKDAAAEPAPEATSQRRGGAGPRQPSIDQLVKQCQAAASRGDCAAAKALAARIAKDDAEAYRARVVKDEAIARCLK